jgi:hypothetical protein
MNPYQPEQGMFVACDKIRPYLGTLSCNKDMNFQVSETHVSHNQHQRVQASPAVDDC